LDVLDLFCGRKNFRFGINGKPGHAFIFVDGP